MRKKLPGFILFSILSIAYGYAQSQPFIEDIRGFKKQDSIHFPPKDAILFVGSSSFTKWTDVQDYFPGYPIINRGFGGSSLPDLIRYADQVIFPYHAKEILIYCGENDLAGSDTLSAQTVFSRFRTLFDMIRKHEGLKPVVFISMKPSPSRAAKMPKFVSANKMIKAFMAEQKQASFVDVYYKMLLPDGKPIPEIFTSDSLHMNAKGYAIWQKAILPYLKK